MGAQTKRAPVGALFVCKSGRLGARDRMNAGALRNRQDADDDKHGNHQRREGPTEIESAVIDGLVEEIADGRTQWPRHDESRPEQKDA